MYRLLLFVIIFSSQVPALSQDATVVVPDLNGLSVPQAAALLNATALQIGEQTTLKWSSESGLTANTIAGQSVTAGTQVASGTVVDVTVLRAPNMELIYDDNDITLVNLSEQTMDFRSLSFADVNNTARFPASRLTSELRGQLCAQVWSVWRNGPKGLSECRFVQDWLIADNREFHFWTAVNGIQEFAVLENDMEIMRCPAAQVGTETNPLRCQLYYGSAGNGNDVTDFLYFEYTPAAIAIINISDDRWMLTTANTIYSSDPAHAGLGAAFRFGDPQLLSEDFRHSPGNPERLAPGQCIVLTSTPGETAAAFLQPCQIIAARDLNPDAAFWLADFEVDSRSGGRRLNCPAALADRPTVCVVAR